MKLEAGIPRPRVLFVYPTEATFIETDLRLLRTFCEVEPLLYKGRATYPKLLFRILRADLVFIWFALGFAAVSSWAARLLRKKSIIVAGGWDVTALPEIGYGRLLTRRGQATASAALTSAHEVLAFSDWSANAIRVVAPQAKVKRVYMGVDPSKFAPQPKEDIVVTVANVTRENLMRKGLQDFVEAARSFPRVPFFLVGRHIDESADDLRRAAPQNLQLPGWIPDTDLRRLLARAKVYVQASMIEGFGVALAEAMASGCVPVVTPAGAIPEVVGNAGLYAPFGDRRALVEAIRLGLTSKLGPSAAGRVRERFTLDMRLAELRGAIFRVLGLSSRADSELGYKGSGQPRESK